MTHGPVPLGADRITQPNSEAEAEAVAMGADQSLLAHLLALHLRSSLEMLTWTSSRRLGPRRCLQQQNQQQ